MAQKNCTFFCDIDGTLFHYRQFSEYKTVKPVPVKNIVSEINELYDEGHHIVIVTARPEYLRVHTMKELDEFDIKYHKLVMEIERGPRILINDNEIEKLNRAYAINIERDKGLTKEDKMLIDFVVE